MRGYDFFLIVLAILAFFSLAAGNLVIVLLFSLIGIPFAFLILLLPALALILGLGRILDRVLLSRFLPNGTTGIASVGVTLLLLAGVPLIANYHQSALVSALQAGDHDDLPRPLPSQIYALLSQTSSQDCTDFCQRMLLTGQVTAVLMSQAAPAAQDPPDPAIPATLWQIKDQPTCPPVALPANSGRMSIKAEPNFATQRADLLIGAGIAAGHCLIATASTLAAADAVIVDATIQEPNYDPGFSLGADMIAAKRYAIWVKSAQGLVEKARWTFVSARKMFFLAVPLIEPEMTSSTTSGFARAGHKWHSDGPGFDNFADQILGLRLSLTNIPSAVTPSGQDPLLAMLQKPGPLDENTQQLAAGRVDAMNLMSEPTTADREIFLAILSDPRVHSWNSGVISFLLRDAPPDFAPAVAAAGFSRMNALLLPDLHIDALAYQDRSDALQKVGHVKREIGIIGNALAELPDTALQHYGHAIFALARDRENRTEPYRLLMRLSAFGEPGARALVALLADADTPMDETYRDYPRQNAYLAAMTGLCRMGPSASFVLPDVLKLVRDGKIRISTEFPILTLIRLGQPADTILALSANEEYPLSTMTIDRAVNAARAPDVCAY